MKTYIYIYLSLLYIYIYVNLPLLNAISNVIQLLQRAHLGTLSFWGRENLALETVGGHHASGCIRTNVSELCGREVLWPLALHCCWHMLAFRVAPLRKITCRGDQKLVSDAYIWMQLERTWSNRGSANLITPQSHNFLLRWNPFIATNSMRIRLMQASGDEQSLAAATSANQTCHPLASACWRGVVVWPLWITLKNRMG